MLGLVGGVMLVASSGAHSLLGWPQLEKSLLQQNVFIAPGLLLLAASWRMADARPGGAADVP